MRSAASCGGTAGDCIGWNAQCFAAIAGDAVDVLFVCGTDFGTQSSQFCSVRTFDEVWAPYYRRVNDWVHRHTRWKTFKHSCGAVRPLIERLFANPAVDFIHAHFAKPGCFAATIRRA